MLVLAALPAESSPSPVDDVLATVPPVPVDPETLVIPGSEVKLGGAVSPHETRTIATRGGSTRIAPAPYLPAARLSARICGSAATVAGQVA